MLCYVLCSVELAMGALDRSLDRRRTPYLVWVSRVKLAFQPKSGYTIVFNTLLKIYIEKNNENKIYVESRYYSGLNITLFGTGINEKGNTET